MENIIGIQNSFSLLFLLATVTILIIKVFKHRTGNKSIIPIIISFLLLVIVTLTNVMEHFQKSDYFDMFEDEIEILFIPLFIFSIFSYCLYKELQINRLKEAELKDSNARLNMSMEGANEALWQWNSKEKYLLINDAYCYLKFELSTYKIDDLNWKESIHPVSYNIYKEFLNCLKNNLQLPDNTEIRIKTTKNDYKWILFRGKQYLLDNELNNFTYLGTLYEIENFIKVQNDLEIARNKAIESEKLKMAFLNNISHEIRTPINAISGFTDLLNNSKTSSEKRLEYSKIISKSCTRLIQVIDDIIDMSHITVGSIKPIYKNTNINEVFNQLSNNYIDAVLKKNLKLLFNSNRIQTIISDEQLLIRILGNLIDNAIKFSVQGEIEISCNNYGDEYIFSVKDSGIGIEKKYHEEVFQNFRQVEISETRFYGGSGLGLSICKGLVKALNGKIWVDSEPDKGTTISFTLPANTGSPQTQNALDEKVKKFNFNSETVLIAEDEESNFLYLNELLEPLFGKVIRANDGLEAIELFKQNPDVKIILMDIKMPIMNGTEAAKEIKILSPQTPIIAQTAYVIAPEDSKQLNCYDGILTKPISREMLLDILKAYMHA